MTGPTTSTAATAATVPRRARGLAWSSTARPHGGPWRPAGRSSPASPCSCSPWQAIVFVGRYPPFILPGPLTVAQRFVRAWSDGTMWPHFSTTLVEVLLGFAIGATLALVVGVLLARSRLAERLLSPYLVAAQATPVLALAPLIALWFGTGLPSKLVITTLIVFFPVAVATMVGLRSRGPAPARDGAQLPRHERPGHPPGRDPGRPAGDPRRHARRDHARRHRRDHRRVGRRRPGPRRAHQHLPRVVVRHPAHVRHPGDPCAARRAALSRAWSRIERRLVGER